LRLATVFYCLRFETSTFVASYDSQGHDGGIRARLHNGLRTDHTEKSMGVFTVILHSKDRGADRIENAVIRLLHACMLRTLPSNGRCLQIHCLERDYTPRYVMS
jgi:hypothetical protein